MKKCIVLFLALLITVLTPIFAPARGEYAIDSATGTLISYTGPGGDIVIPDFVDGTPVKALGTALFNQHAAITSVKVPCSAMRVISCGIPIASGPRPSSGDKCPLSTK